MAVSMKNISASQLHSAILIVAFLFLICGIGFGVLSGINIGHAEATYKNAMLMNTALGYYYNDQNSYPSENQLYSNDILTLYYLNSMPAPVSPGGVCKQYTQFYYSQNTPNDYALVFCLQKPVYGLSAGVHELTQNGLAE